MTDRPTKKRIVKIQLDPADHDVLRLAAAMRRQNMAEFAREVAMAEARRLAAGIELPPAPEA